MKILLSHSSQTDYKNELYAPIRGSELSKQYEFVLPYEDIETQFSTKELCKSGSVDLVIADVSVPSHGVGIELGWAEMLGIPIVCIFKEGSEYSRSLSMVCKKFLMYTSRDNMLSDLEILLRDF